MDRPTARQNLYLAGVIIVVVAAIATVGASIWVRAAYGIWLPTQTPERIPLCEQTYTKRDDRVFTREQVGRGDTDPSPIILEPNVGRLPIGVATPARYEPGAGYNGCGQMLALHTGMNEYVLYFKLGGP